jgi:RNA:NAD 2'-phosphotransferase (TPT1/KptA family)
MINQFFVKNWFIIWLKLEKDGWIDINELLSAINASKNNKVGQIDRSQLMKIVKECPKQRFGLNETDLLCAALMH